MTQHLVYFDALMLNRQRLLWALATRRQLERWEPYVAASLDASLRHREIPDPDVWAAANEHHFALIAARNLIHALDLPPDANHLVGRDLREALIAGRDLHEHWVENMPIFNATPRPAEPRYPSGKRFAARNPRDSAYYWLSWSSDKGPELLPDVAAAAVHDLLDRVERHVLASNDSLRRFIPPRAPSPWARDGGIWWPTPT
jgi:hypothetical protein